MSEYETYFNNVLQLEQAGLVDEAVKMINVLVDTFPERKEEVLLEAGKLKFRNGKEKEALFDFISLYNDTKEQALYDLILEAYYSLNTDELEKTYHNNERVIKEYTHLYIAQDLPSITDVFPIWWDDDTIVYHAVDRRFGTISRSTVPSGEIKDEIVLLLNAMWSDDITLWLEKSKSSMSDVGRVMPVYLFYSEELWQIYLQMHDLSKIIPTNRFIITIGKEMFRTCLEDKERYLPSYVWGMSDYLKDTEAIVNQSLEIRLTDRERYLNSNVDYYAKHADQVIENISEGHPTILFFTSIYTTAMQYYMRDFEQSAKKLGCKTRRIIQKDQLHQLLDEDLVIDEVHPDIVFLIDHFRFRKSDKRIFPKQLVVITWMQDPLPWIMDPKSNTKLIARDVLLNQYPTWDKLRNIYYSRPMIEADCSANDDIYHPYNMSEEEKNLYECDLCMVCHSGNVNDLSKKIFASEDQETANALVRMTAVLQDEMYRTGRIIFGEENIKEWILQYPELVMTDEVASKLAECIYEQGIFPLMYRHIIVRWLLDAGFTNIKLWGKHWDASERTKPYAMGPATNGEVLSKIVQSAKIVLGNNAVSTTVSRAGESMLSGAFYLSNYIPPEYDMGCILRFYKEDKDLIMYHDRDDLINKVRYYLVHDKEREYLAKKGRQTALKYLTYDALVKKVLKEIPEILRKQEKECGS